MNLRTKARAAQIREKVPILQVLYDYGYHVHPDGMQEQQYPCDLHGSGHDNKPSARVYPYTNSTYCFGCDKARGVIDIVIAKEGLSFSQTLDLLERKYKLPPVPYEIEDLPEKAPPEFLEERAAFSILRDKFKAALQSLTEDRLIPMQKALSFWEAYDKLIFQLDNGKVSPEQAPEIIKILYNRLLEIAGVST